MKYFSTRGGSERLSFEEVNPHNMKPRLFVIPHTDRPHRACSKRRTLHPRKHSFPTTKLEIQMAFLYFRPTLRRRPIIIHLHRGNFDFGVDTACGEIVC